MSRVLVEKADALRALHHRPEPLVLPNAWDVASARTFAEAGFPAIATTSGGVASSLGYPDGEAIPADVMLAAVARIAAAVDVPVTADLEAGYGMSPEELVNALLATGAVGMNHEDTMHDRGGALRPVSEQAGKIAALKEAGRRRGVDLVLNARVDVYLRAGVAAPDAVLSEAVGRGVAYTTAGADSVFPIFVRALDHIETLAREVRAPLNVFALKGMPSIQRLGEMGVKRISFGSGLMRVALSASRDAAEGLRAGRYPWD